MDQSRTLGWQDWQRAVVALLQDELCESVHQVSVTDVDWTAWQRFYAQQRSPKEAVLRALERDL